MTNPIPPSGGWAPEDAGQPGEFNAGPGYMARECGVPVNLDPRRFTLRQRAAGRVVPPLPVSGSRAASALRATESTDPTSTPDPYALGGPPPAVRPWATVPPPDNGPVYVEIPVQVLTGDFDLDQYGNIIVDGGTPYDDSDDEAVIDGGSPYESTGA